LYFIERTGCEPENYIVQIIRRHCRTGPLGRLCSPKRRRYIILSEDSLKMGYFDLHNEFLNKYKKKVKNEIFFIDVFFYFRLMVIQILCNFIII
jgi:hypothetical protein